MSIFQEKSNIIPITRFHIYRQLRARVSEKLDSARTPGTPGMMDSLQLFRAVGGNDGFQHRASLENCFMRLQPSVFCGLWRKASRRKPLECSTLGNEAYGLIDSASAEGCLGIP
jgi:hypothetical protein